MRRTLFALAVLAALASAACTVSRDGTLALVPDGPTIHLKVSVTNSEIVVGGVDPATGERLSGTLSRVGGERGSQEPWDAGSSKAPPSPGAGGVVSSGETELRMNVAGILEGDHGTRLRCVAEVERRLYLRGGGTCVAAEGGEGAPSYRLKF
jgi:hypothetical protein